MSCIKHLHVLYLAAMACFVMSCSSTHYAAKHTPIRKQSSSTASLQFIDDIHVYPEQSRSTASSASHQVGEYGMQSYSSSVTTAGLQEKFARILHVTPAMISNIALYRFIDTWLGTPYKYGGDDEQGIDCSAFVQRLYDEVYHIHLDRTALGLYRIMDLIRNQADLREGDLVFFHTGHGKHINHVGVYLQNRYFVQASTSNGVIISNLDEPYWKQHYAAGGRIKETNAQDMAGR
ncbi:NlpC/P60 family protein [Thermoflavifilum thermophilum]|uniref:NlpC/P60 family protein n=1 Tax=Thermoflavifilum thermophilum TaxID=1393122 RepID=A0A1I7N0Q4_9BACT|nr:NlpC/P60 family protein [Thermoflavifilum thermophilum]